MTNLKLIVNGAKARAEVNGILTAGAAGIPVAIQYDSAWDGLIKNFVCTSGKWGPTGTVKTILNVNNAATVAYEVMTTGNHLYVGVEGRSADGALVIHTVWVDCGTIFAGADANTDPSAKTALPIWAQLQLQINELRSNGAGNTGNNQIADCCLKVVPITVGEDTDGTVSVTGLSLDLTTYSAKVGGGFYINPIVVPGNATNRAVTWKSNATNIATVSSSGYVECIAEGDAVITCTTMDGGFAATCAVSVAAAESSGGETEVTLSSISAAYSGGDVAVGTSVTALTGIVVTAHYSDGSTEAVTGYTLSGTIAEGSNTVTVSYGGKTATFTVTGVAESGGTTGEKVQFSTLEITDGMMGPSGSIIGIGSTYHVTVPYTEGMIVSTGVNSSWVEKDYPGVVVLDNGTYTVVYRETAGTSVSVGGKYATPCTYTVSGFSADAVVYVSFLAGGTEGSTLETYMDKAGFYYYIPGGES